MLRHYLFLYHVSVSSQLVKNIEVDLVSQPFNCCCSGLEFYGEVENASWGREKGGICSIVLDKDFFLNGGDGQVDSDVFAEEVPNGEIDILAGVFGIEPECGEVYQTVSKVGVQEEGEVFHDRSFITLVQSQVKSNRELQTDVF